jgi:RHS repeat-associated protein
VQELNGSTVVANLLTGLGIDEYLFRTDTSGTRYFLSEALGSTVALSDSLGAVPTTYTYAPFGATSLSGSATGSTFDYTGREDDGTGLKYYRARYYHPGRQRFVSEDPIGFASGDVNFYSYVGNDPLNATDPVGLTALTNAEFLLGFLFGGPGSNDRVYKSTPFAQPIVQLEEMKASIAARKMRAAFVGGGCKDRRDFAYGTFEAAWDTILSPWTGDLSSTATQVGGFVNASIVNNRDGTITLTIKNEAGAKSFFYHLVGNAPWQSGPLSTIRQTFEWTEAAPSICAQPPSLARRK